MGNWHHQHEKFKGDPVPPTEEELQVKTLIMLSRTLKIPIEILDKKPHLLNIELDTTVAARVFAPACLRSIQGYCVSANGVFESARFVKESPGFFS